MVAVTLKVASLPSSKSDFAYLDKAFVSPGSFAVLGGNGSVKTYIAVQNDVFLLGVSDAIEDGQLCMSGPQRMNSKLSMQDYSCVVYPIEQAPIISNVTLSIDVLKKGETGSRFEIEGMHFAEEHVKVLLGDHVLKPGMNIPTKYRGKKLNITVKALQQSFQGDGVVALSGRLDDMLSQVELVLGSGASAAGLVLKDGKTKRLEFKSNFNFEEMGIGGLDEQFTSMFRKAFATRMFPGIVSKMGMNHVRGMLLYGPPGCGKTLIARQIARVLDVEEGNIKIVNGPEVLSKMIGESEENIRKQFQDAEDEYKREGDNSSLHIIIFDEMDSIMKVRGKSDNLGVGDNIVNQLLSKIDGVDALNNILVIGMTNRKDMIDPAILRPGRLEVHIEVPLPNKQGREQILRIKTKKMKDNGMITQECLDRLPELAGMIENYTGAECEAFVSYASKYVLARNIDGTNVSAASQDPTDYILGWADFMKAIDNHDVIPAFGNKPDDDLKKYFRHDIIHYGASFDACYGVVSRLLNQVKNSANTKISSVLLEGHAYTGKTAIAADLAFNSGFPYIRMVTPDMFIGLSSMDICNKLHTLFTDSYKSKLSIIILDDIERIIGYTAVGPRFDVNVLQTLMVMIRKPPTDPECSLFVMATTSISHELEDLGLVNAFSVSQHISQLQQSDEICMVLEKISASGGHAITKEEIADIGSAITSPIGIKQLLETLEMAESEASADEGDDEVHTVSAALFLSCLHVRGF
jgi:vesicle-fusing ATPase